MNNLQILSQKLELVREGVLGNRPIIITSGYRSPELNAAIGGSVTSDHITGFVADWTCPSFGSPRDVFDAVRSSGIAYDQLILEFNKWVHLSFSPRRRQQELIASFVNNKAVYRFA